MREALGEDQFAEVRVVRDDDPRLGEAQCEDGWIVERRTIVNGDGRDVMSLSTEPDADAVLSILVEEESHNAALERRRFARTGVGKISSPATSACAYSMQAFTSSRVSRG